MQTQASVLIRRARPTDVTGLGRLGGALMRLHHSFDPQRFMTPPDDAERGYGWFLASLLDADDALVLVAERQDTGGQSGDESREAGIVGYCYGALEPQSWKELRDAAGFIHDLVVDDSARGRGIGSNLMREMMRWLREKGAPRVVLSTAEANPAARHLFGHLGFRPTMVEMTRELDGQE